MSFRWKGPAYVDVRWTLKGVRHWSSYPLRLNIDLALLKGLRSSLPLLVVTGMDQGTFCETGHSEWGKGAEFSLVTAEDVLRAGFGVLEEVALGVILWSN